MELHQIKNKILQLASNHGYRHIRTQEWCMNFERFKDNDRVAINVYWRKKVENLPEPLFAVQTALDHPKMGKTQLNRKGINFQLLGKIFANPRQHTGKGYY